VRIASGCSSASFQATTQDAALREKKISCSIRVPSSSRNLHVGQGSAQNSSILEMPSGWIMSGA